jgi:hypothetical protein
VKDASWDARDGGLKVGGGTIIYPNSDVRRIDRRSQTFSFVASVLGLSTVEYIRENGGHFEASPIVAPPVENAQCGSSPRASSAIAVGDLDDDERDDVLVFDTCGNWVAKGSGAGVFESSSWSSLLQPVGSYPFLEFFDADNVNSKSIVGGFGGTVVIIRPSGAGKGWGDPVRVSMPEPHSDGRTTHLFTMLPPASDARRGRFLMQSHRRMVLLPIETLDVDAGLSLTVLDQAVHAPYLAPFDGFDHLSTISVAGCPATTVGIGVFSQSAGKVARRLQAIELGDRYSATDIPTNFDDVTTIAVLAREPEGDAMIGIYGAAGGKNTFALWQLSPCGQWTQLADVTIEFDWRTPEAPGFGSGAVVPKTYGVKIEAARVAGELWFVHYDGWDIRMVRAAGSATGWFLTEEKYNVHKERHDLSFGSPP